MGRTPQNKKRSFFKTRLGKYAAKLGNEPEKFNKAMSHVAGAEQSAIRSVIGSRLAHSEKNSKRFKDLGKDDYACVPKEHVKQEKQEKAIGHIKKLFEQINELQDEIDNNLQTEIHLEREIFDSVAINEESHHTPQRKHVKKHHKQQPDELPVINKAAHISKERSQRKTEKDDSPYVNNKKVRKKLCLQCKKKKAKNEFHKDRSTKDGLARWCKECKADAAKKYRKKPTDTEQGASRNLKEKSQPTCSMETPMDTTKTNTLVKTEKILKELQKLGMKYGCGSDPEYTIESHYQFICKMADRTIKDITVVVREKDVSVFCRPNLPGWFEGNNQADDALKEVERLLHNPN